MRIHRRAAVAALIPASCVALAACIAPPPATPGTPEPAPLPTSEPTTAPTSAPSPAPPTDPPSSAPADLPTSLPVGEVLAEGTLPGWETSILTADGFEPQADTTFPAGPLIHVIETASACDVWAYQGQQDGTGTDEREQTEATLAAITDTTPDQWTSESYDIGPSASQGVTVEFLSIAADDEQGVEAIYARNFQSSRTTSTIRISCPTGVGGLDHADGIVDEHFSINFLQP